MISRVLISGAQGSRLCLSLKRLPLSLFWEKGSTKPHVMDWSMLVIFYFITKHVENCCQNNRHYCQSWGCVTCLSSPGWVLCSVLATFLLLRWITMTKRSLWKEGFIWVYRSQEMGLSQHGGMAACGRHDTGIGSWLRDHSSLTMKPWERTEVGWSYILPKPSFRDNFPPAS